ncbi:MAG: hypothetical protein ACD_20C00425G0003 [uncultured bacterium]|nr:MAG: hypothetical protein ACD_20C00425G0003 [uncultured bacterium]HBH18524.1 hypothetical protein [Cyanobacteria bacterium UBA9579]
MKKEQIEQLNHQIQLLCNNNSSFSVLESHIDRTKAELEVIKGTLPKLEQELTYSKRAIEVIKQGYESVHENLEDIITS